MTQTHRRSSMPYQDSYYLPERISRVVRGHHNHYQNPGLILDKYVPRIVIDDTKQKGPWLRTLCTEYAIDKELVQAIYQRWQAFLTAQNARDLTRRSNGVWLLVWAAKVCWRPTSPCIISMASRSFQAARSRGSQEHLRQNKKLIMLPQRNWKPD